MFKEGLGYRVGVTSFSRKDGKRRSVGYEHRVRQERADKIWVLKACTTRGEATYWEQYFSVAYSLPTWIFYTDGRRTSYTDADIAKLFDSVDTRKGARKLLHDLHMYEAYPHHVPRALSKNRRRTFTITMLGDTRNGSHKFAISGSDDEDGKLLEDLAYLGVHVRPAKFGRGWRVETARKSLGDVYRILREVQKRLHVTIKEQIKFACGRLPLTPASHVRPGMRVFVTEEDSVVLDEIELVEFEENALQMVYDLNVDQLHHFSANGILTHNSLYAFRGAEPEVLRSHFERAWPKVRRFNLPINYRSTKEIIRTASILISHNYNEQTSIYLKPFEARPNAPQGDPIKTLRLDSFRALSAEVTTIGADAPSDWFVLSRTCAECSAIHTELVRQKIPAINKSGGMLFGTAPIRKALAYARLACDYKNARNDLEVLSEIANVATIHFRAPFTRRRHKAGCTNTKGWVDCGCPIIMESDVDYCHARYYGQAAIQDAGGWVGVREQQWDRNRGGYPTTRAKGAADLYSFVMRLEALADDAGACLRKIISDCVLPWTAAEYGFQDADLAEDGAVESIDLLLSMLKPDTSITEFLQEVDSITAGDTTEDESKAVILSTIHRSKGLERPGVVLNATRLPIVAPTPIPGKLPMGRPATIEEERRLAYVAITRAQEEVVVVSSREWNQQELPQSRFIRDAELN
jgi:DNA helicase-2/ATP-dependent DNA helicase PcrA